MEPRTFVGVSLVGVVLGMVGVVLALRRRLSLLYVCLDSLFPGLAGSEGVSLDARMDVVLVGVVTGSVEVGVVLAVASVSP